MVERESILVDFDGDFLWLYAESRVNFFLKTNLAAWIDGWTPSKIRLFLVFQIDQHIKIVVAMKNWDRIWSLIWEIASGNVEFVGASIWMFCQHWAAKGHWRNKCWAVSSVLLTQNTQSYDWSSIFFFLECSWCSTYHWLAAKKTPYA